MTKKMYAATFRVRGTVCRSVYAESDEEAKSKLVAMMDDEGDDGFWDLETIDDICLISEPTQVRLLKETTE